MKNNLFFINLIVFTLIVFQSCNKNDNHIEKPYSNMNDTKTTSLELTIPRIEIPSLKSTKIKLYLSVTDQEGDPLKFFNPYNFEIKQVCYGSTDTTLIGIISLKELNESGNNVAISSTLDYSGSMGDTDVENMEEAIKYFIGLKEKEDYMEIIKFATNIQVVSDFTNNENDLINAIDNIPYQGETGTAFYDALYRSISDGNDFYLQNIDYLPAVLGFTDGDDNESQYSINSIIDLAQKTQIPIYTIGFGDPNTNAMNMLANETGGRYFFTPNANELDDLYSLISGQLKNLYLIEWSFDDPKCKQIVIVVKVSYSCANGNFVAYATKYFYLSN